MPETTRHHPLHRLRWLSGEGAFYAALVATGLTLVALVFGFVDALDFMDPRTEYWRPAHAAAVGAAAPAAVAALVAAVAGVRAAAERRRPGWGVAAACVATCAGTVSALVLSTR